MNKSKTKNSGSPWKNKKGSLHPVAKEVIQKDKNGNRIQPWQSIEQAAHFFKTDKSNISKCCQGKRRTAKGFKWEYKHPDLQRCYQYDKDWLLIKQHNTIRLAATRTDLKAEQILLCCEGRIEFVGGFYWRFIRKRY